MLAVGVIWWGIEEPTEDLTELEAGCRVMFVDLSEACRS